MTIPTTTWHDGLIVEPKDPDSKEPRGLDWTPYLAELGEDVTIETSTWTVSPSGLTIISDSVVEGSLKTQLRLGDGTPGQTYVLTNHIVASDGTEDDRSITIRVKER